ncbi:MAG: hypothetical protein HY731_11005 [Candidatus Tectomicrobia bacterium]|nr:hypothetical protein [Candidatus Tectomicrobia bacterium]
MTTNLVQKVTRAADLDKLRELTGGIIGETCWRASLSYGDELRLHIGARLLYSKKSMMSKEKGAWMVGTRGTAWRLDSPSKTLATSEDDPEIVRQSIHHIEGTILTLFEISYPDLALRVTFNNGCTLILFPSAEDDSGLPYWELFTPYRMLLKVGPGARWSYIRSDLPETSE